MLYPDLRRLATVRPTGMMAAPAPGASPPFNTNQEQSRAAAEVARRVAAAQAAARDNVVTIWQGLTPPQQQAVINLLELELQRKRNELYADSTMEKERVTKGMNNQERVLPAYLGRRKWKQQPWQVVLNGPGHGHLFEAVEGPGFYGHQIGEDQPNQPKDYGRGLVYNPYGAWENPFSHTGSTGAFNDDYQREYKARLAWEALDRLNDLTPPDGVPPAPPPPPQQPELNAWNGLNGNKQNIVLEILAEKKKLRNYRGGYRGDGPQVPDSVAKAIEGLTAQLPPALNTPKKFDSVDWELALEGQPEYDYVFGLD